MSDQPTKKEVKVFIGNPPQEGWGCWRFREKDDKRCTQFLPEGVFDMLGMEQGKTYKITIEEIEHDYI